MEGLICKIPGKILLMNILGISKMFRFCLQGFKFSSENWRIIAELKEERRKLEVFLLILFYKKFLPLERWREFTQRSNQIPASLTFNGAFYNPTKIQFQDHKF